MAETKKSVKTWKNFSKKAKVGIVTGAAAVLAAAATATIIAVKKRNAVPEIEEES